MTPQQAALRVILYHKQATSARTRFMRLAHDSVCTLGEIPPLSQVVEAGVTPAIAPAVTPHPATALRQLAQWLGLELSELKLEGDFHMHLDTPGQCLSVYLVQLLTTDPPFEGARRQGARFVELTALRDLPPAELELLRSAYKVIMEG